MAHNFYKQLYRPTYAKVHLGALQYNYQVIKKILPKGVGIMAMVKADAYGHGAVEVSKELEKCGISSFGVATVEEGLELRSAGIRAPILVMGGLLGLGDKAAKIMIGAGLTSVVHSSSVVSSLEKVAAQKGIKAKVHLKIDTGMNRLGVKLESLHYLLSKLKEARHLEVEGVMTHLAQAGKNDFTKGQLELFDLSKEMIEKELGKIPIWHMANSTAIMDNLISVSGAEKKLVRPGISLYGFCGEAARKGIKLKPAMNLVSHIALLKHSSRGSKVSYDSTYTVKKESMLAVVPIGYADGYPWSVSGKALVLVEGKRVPVVGRVTMDMIVVDVTSVDRVEVGSEVVLMGSQGRETIAVDEIARWAGTIPYEIFCGVSKRMPRVYVR